MTEHTIFDEVKEDLERQRLEALWRRYGVWVVILALAIVVGTGGWTAYCAWTSERDQRVTTDFLAATKDDVTDLGKSIDSLQKFAGQNPGASQSDIALLRAGALAADQNDKAKAASFFDRVAADAKADPAFRQLGDLLSVQTQMDSGDAAALSARLDPLTAKHAPWRFSALEAQGYLAIRAGDKARATQIFTELSQDARAPQSIGARATDILRSLN